MVAFNPQNEAIPRKDSRIWLRRAEQHRGDAIWLMHHEELLHSVLAHDLNQPSLYLHAMDLLTSIFPIYVIERGHVDKWLPIIYYALAPAINLKRDDCLMRVYSWLGEIYLKKGEAGQARGAFTNALSRAREGTTHEVVVAASTGLFRLQWFDLKQHFNEAMVERALASNRQIDDPVLQVRLYAALCAAYTEMGDTTRAIGYGQMGYGLALRANNMAEIGRAAFDLAISYRLATFFHQLSSGSRLCQIYTEIAQSHLPVGEDDAWQTIRLIYQHAFNQFGEGNYRAAEYGFQTALDAVEGLNISPYYVATILQALGVTEVELGKLEAARQHYHQAWLIWRKTRDWAHHVTLLHALGFLEGRRARFLAGRVILRRARRLCDKLSDTPRRAHLETLIDQSLQEIESR